jgi:hypothetical protein
MWAIEQAIRGEWIRVGGTYATKQEARHAAFAMGAGHFRVIEVTS